MSSKKLNLFKDFQSDQIQRSSRKIFTAHYACRNAALNLTPVTETTNGFIFQIINSLIESWGVSLTWFDSKGLGDNCYSPNPDNYKKSKKIHLHGRTEVDQDAGENRISAVFQRVLR